MKSSTCRRCRSPFTNDWGGSLFSKQHESVNCLNILSSAYRSVMLQLQIWWDTLYHWWKSWHFFLNTQSVFCIMKQLWIQRKCSCMCILELFYGQLEHIKCIIQWENRGKVILFLCQPICMNEKQPAVQSLLLSFPFTYFSRRCVFPKIQLKGFYNSFKFTFWIQWF